MPFLGEVDRSTRVGEKRLEEAPITDPYCSLQSLFFAVCRLRAETAVSALRSLCPLRVPSLAAVASSAPASASLASDVLLLCGPSPLLSTTPEASAALLSGLRSRAPTQNGGSRPSSFVQGHVPAAEEGEEGLVLCKLLINRRYGNTWRLQGGKGGGRGEERGKQGAPALISLSL